MWASGISFVSLLFRALALWTDMGPLLLVLAAAMMWGQYWPAQRMTVPRWSPPTRYKATACGFGYIFVKLGQFRDALPVSLAGGGTARRRPPRSCIYRLGGFWPGS